MSDPKRPSFRAFIRRLNPGKGNESSSDSIGTPASTPPVSQGRLPAGLPSASASSMSVSSVNVAVTKDPLPGNVSVGCSASMAEHGDTISTTDYECKDQQVRFQQLWKEAIDNAKASKGGGKLSEVIRVQEQAAAEDAEITLPALIKRLETEMKRFGTQKRLAEAMERIVPHLNRFAVVGDIAVSTNPNPAALPWAANLTAREEIRGKVVEGIAEITVLVFECSVYHELYLASPASTDLPINTNLRQTIIDALSHCVRFLGFALRRQQAAAKAFTDVFRLEDFTGYLKDLNLSKDKLHDAGSLCEIHQSSRSRDQLKSLHDLMIDIRLESSFFFKKESDFLIFLRQALESFVVEYNRTHHQKHLQLPSDWPGDERFQVLLHKSLPLFIAAATFVRMICDRHWSKSPNYKIDFIIDNSTKVNSEYEALYKPVLSLILSGAPDEDQDEVKQSFCDIIGSLVLLASPLPVTSLANLLGTDVWDIFSQIDPLRSVIDVPEDDSPLQLFHLSFRDYILSQSAGDLQVNEMKTHADLAKRCLGLMRVKLKTDICRLEAPGRSHTDVEPSVLDEHLPPEIQYACLYWVHHLRATGGRVCDGDDASSFLQRFFRNWLEVLCLLRRLDDSLLMLEQLQSIVDETSGTQLQQFIQDAIQFIRYFRAGIEQTPLQLYHSGTIFSPKASIAPSRLEDRQYPDYILQPSNIDLCWPQSQTFEVLGGKISRMAFLSDKKLATICRQGNLKIWDQKYCSCLHSLSQGSPTPMVILTCHDSRTVAVGWSEMIKIWNLDTVACIRTLFLQGYSDIDSIAFSDDGSWGIIRIWDMESATCKEKLEPVIPLIAQTSIAAATDVAVFAVLEGTSVEVWYTDPLRCVTRFMRGYTFFEERYHCLAISANGERLAVGSSLPGLVEIWDVNNALLEYRLELPLHDYPRIAFSHDGAKIAYLLMERIENGEKLLWVPPDYRPKSVYLSGMTMVLGTFSGRVLFLYFR
uniref:Vegetative incompatibility protein HET-E-1 n=1 Tax=Fusarium oxysporum (strain Fo5176) TaxID=660025 RepID=A0A0D2YDX0_FUSOF